jgi:hypothetical protein
MPKALRAVLLGCLLSGFLAGCVYVEESNHQGDVEFFWTLNGWSCTADPRVHVIRITIPGERLHNDGNFPCSFDGAQGIVLQRFFPGTYGYIIEALDIYGALLYSSSGTFYVNGYTPVQVELRPVTAAIRLSWILADAAGGAHKCSELAIGDVVVHIDGVERRGFGCSEGEHPYAAVSIPDIQFGTHRLEVYAWLQDNTYFNYSGTFSLLSHGPENVFVVLRR